MNKLNEQEILRFYENIDTVWPVDDKWHLINQREINNYITKSNLLPNNIILNAGSGGNDYGLSLMMYHLDIAKSKIEHLSNSFIGSIESIPFPNQMFDTVICVGSVLNYCDAAVSISEMARVLRLGGQLILEFESSYGYEYWGSTAYKKSAAIANTEYFDQPHNMWIYSEKYIRNILTMNSLIIKDAYQYHILSGLIYRFTKSENYAAKYVCLDRILRHIPIIRNHASNLIFRCEKQ